MNTNKYKTVIYSDSKSCLIAIGKLSNKNFLIRKIQETLLDLLRSGHTINLVWIPSHQGIMGNEQVDREAKEALKKEQPDNIQT